MTNPIWNAPSKDPNYDANQKAREEAFKKIRPAGNWKNPIDCWVSRADLDDAIEATIWFCGGGMQVMERRYTPEKGDEVRVTAPGYYMMIGA